MPKEETGEEYQLPSDEEDDDEEAETNDYDIMEEVDSTRSESPDSSSENFI